MTTINHPANDPVSLERLHQISEILSKAAAQSDGGNLGYAMADAVKVIDGAISAFGVEPVGYFYADKPGDWYQISDGDRVPEHRRIPLYSNPQSGPVVKLPNEFISSEGIVVQIEKLMAVLAVHGIQYERKGNTCRAAMIQNAEPVTKPYKLPPHVYRELVNSLRDTAVKYHGCQQLREQISETLSSVITHTPHCGNSPVTPDGWVMVPKEINCAMDDAAWEAYHETRCMSDIWAALLAAAPKQEVKGG